MRRREAIPFGRRRFPAVTRGEFQTVGQQTGVGVDDHRRRRLPVAGTEGDRRPRIFGRLRALPSFRAAAAGDRRSETGSRRSANAGLLDRHFFRLPISDLRPPTQTGLAAGPHRGRFDVPSRSCLRALICLRLRSMTSVAAASPGGFQFRAAPATVRRGRAGERGKRKPDRRHGIRDQQRRAAESARGEAVSNKFRKGPSHRGFVRKECPAMRTLSILSCLCIRKQVRDVTTSCRTCSAVEPLQFPGHSAVVGRLMNSSSRSLPQ